MSTFKIKKGDTVKVIAGKDKDKEGKVISVNPKKGAVLVEGANMVTKHTKPSMANQQGGIVEKEAWLDVSNVMLVHESYQSRLQDGRRQESAFRQSYRQSNRLIREEAILK